MARFVNHGIDVECSDYDARGTQRALRCDVSGTGWGLGDLEPVLSGKDAAAGTLEGFESPVPYEERAS